jgi:glycosyltransferase involved in cell wall biosynthesis
MSARRPAATVAILHDYLTQYGGAERVLEELCAMWPEADLYTTFYDRDRLARLGFRVPNRIHTILPVWWPHNGRAAKLWTFAYPVAWRLLKLKRYDVVISSTSFAAHHARLPGDTPHISYCHSPPRFLYGLTTELNHAQIRRRVPIAGPIYGVLRALDQKAARRVTIFVANSQEVRARIARVYGRTAELIYPPVDVERFATIIPVRGEYFLTWGRLVASKRVDLAIRAAALAGVSLIVAGTGPEEARLRALAGSKIRFMGRVSDRERSALLARCRAVLFPAEEDFGLVPVEAMAAGKPVIAYGAGGALESVVAGETGEFFSPAEAEVLAQVLTAWEDDRYRPARCRERAREFDASLFRERMGALVADCLSGRTADL